MGDASHANARRQVRAARRALVKGTGKGKRVFLGGTWLTHGTAFTPSPMLIGLRPLLILQIHGEGL
ncbi:MAG: hypothetical protein GYA24_05395 [Candidatus Lokiarchaeota archaeon]|nr:hypothetical protein [Candidatus Lokiarchaeota archaeon]